MTRRTLRAPIRIPERGHGLALFTGAQTAVTVEPAPAHHGVKIQLADAEAFPACIDHLDTRPPHPAFATLPPRCTTLAAGEREPPVHTVEHVLAALAGLGITDALVRIDSSSEAFEVPILDGSAGAIVEAIALIGVAAHADASRWVALPRPVEVTQADAVVRCDPCPPEDARFGYELRYDHPFLGEQSAAWDAADTAGFAATVARARTFSLEAEARAAQDAGLFPGLTPTDLLVIGDDGPIDNELRFDNEPAAHKLLDLVGDLALAANLLGGPIAMRVLAHKSGHALHHLAARAIVRAVRGN